MEVLISFNDENKELAKAIGLGLIYYGDPLAQKMVEEISKQTTTAATDDDLGTLDEWIAKYGEPVDPSDWAKVPDRLIPSKEVFPGVDENAVADAIDTAGKVDTAAAFAEPAKTVTPKDDGPEVLDPGEAGDVQTDELGVPFNAEFCGVSKDPFYATGKRVGQWKKKRGVDIDDYDAWYETAKPAPAAAEPGQVDTASAFAPPGSEPAPAGDEALPTTPGDLMKWCAEQTAGGSITTAEVTAAYAACGITVADMFGPDGEAHVQAILKELLK